MKVNMLSKMHIRDGSIMVNASQLCDAAGRTWSAYRQNIGTGRMIAALEKTTGLPYAALVVQNPRGNINERHTWVHPHIAEHLRHWIANGKGPRGSSGCVYAVTSPIVGLVKIGKWTGSLKGLHGRYITSYGPEVQVVSSGQIDDSALTETVLHSIFSPFALGGELFDKTIWSAACEMIEMIA